MSESNKGISLVIMILSIILLMIIGLFVYWEFFSNDNKEEDIFFKEGNLMINNPGFIEGVWYLSYESQGNSANSIKLSFNENSICNNETNCSDLVSGDRVEIRGVETNNEVLIKELRKID